MEKVSLHHERREGLFSTFESVVFKSDCVL